MKEKITFTALANRDFPLLVKWLNELHVRRWYNLDPKIVTEADVEKKFLPRITGNEPVSGYIIKINEVPVGYIQVYDARIFASEEYSSIINKYLYTISHLAGIDLYIGEVDYLHKGHGLHIIKQFLQRVVKFHYEGCIVDPDQENSASIRVFEKSGFKYLTSLKINNKKHALLFYKFKE
jgi:RimJ/RimL family protein N-acetyltransferase